MPIFYPYRALGYVTDRLPFVVQRRGRQSFVTVSVGKAWQIYNCAKLSLVFVGPQLEKSIQALASWRDYTFAAYGRHVAVFNRAHQVATLNSHTGKVLLLLVFGNHLISVGEDQQLLLWSLDNLSSDARPHSQLVLPDGFTPSCILHPDTYLNKVLIGSEEGKLQLWNVSTLHLVYEFKGWGSAVRCCVSSPALDTVGVGCADGTVRVHNLKFDELVTSFSHTSQGPITSLSFQTDGQPILAAGGASGVVSLWDLEKQQLVGLIKDAHDGPVTSLYFFPNEPVLMSSGADNSLKIWIFDSAGGEARLLRFRSGHSAPPCCIQYYGKGKHLLSAGQDRAFRIFSTIQDQQSRELSQGHLGKRAKKLKRKEEDLKLTRVSSFASAEIRERDWCNVVTCHENDPAAYTWRLRNFVIGDHILRPPGGNATPVTACAISVCGNFAVIGTAGGRIERFNLQSGLHRASYQADSAQYSGAHKGALVGLECDSSNTHIISGGYDGIIKVWELRSKKLKCSMDVGSPLVKLIYHRSNGLVVVASDDLAIRVYDALAARLVRKFVGHSDRITDLCMSLDGRWLLSSAMDATVRTWNMISARALDTMAVDKPVVALSMSPGMDMLATAHLSRRGIYLWANRAMYSGLEDADVFGSGKTVEPVAMPNICTGVINETLPPVEEGVEDEAGNDSLEGTVVPEIALPIRDDPEAQRSDSGGVGDESKGVGELGRAEQLEPQLITLAMLPRAQWQSLINLDVIKARNKPIEPPKKPEQAPFFLPTLASVSGQLSLLPQAVDSQEDLRQKAISRVLKRDRDSGPGQSSLFLDQLHHGAATGEYSSLVDHIRNLSPSAIDLELQKLEVVDEEADEAAVTNLCNLLSFLATELSSNKNFELLQALLCRTLTIHGDAILRIPRLREQSLLLLNQQSSTWLRLDDRFQQVRCMVGLFSNIQTL